MGIEPTQSAWKAEVLPLNYTRFTLLQQTIQHSPLRMSGNTFYTGGGGRIRTFEGRAVRFTV